MVGLFRRKMICCFESEWYERNSLLAALNVEPIAIMRHTSSGARKKTPSLVGDDFANKYKKIDVSDLKSYEQNRGRYIEGVLLTDPFTPIIGTTTVLEDCNGDAVVLAL